MVRLSLNGEKPSMKLTMDFFPHIKIVDFLSFTNLITMLLLLITSYQHARISYWLCLVPCSIPNLCHLTPNSNHLSEILTMDHTASLDTCDHV